MEDTLRAIFQLQVTSAKTVLILVLMEDTLRVAVNSIYGSFDKS